MHANKPFIRFYLSHLAIITAQGPHMQITHPFPCISYLCHTTITCSRHTKLKTYLLKSQLTSFANTHSANPACHLIPSLPSPFLSFSQNTPIIARPQLPPNTSHRSLVKSIQCDMSSPTYHHFFSLRPRQSSHSYNFV